MTDDELCFFRILTQLNFKPEMKNNEDIDENYQEYLSDAMILPKKQNKQFQINELLANWLDL